MMVLSHLILLPSPAQGNHHPNHVCIGPLLSFLYVGLKMFYMKTENIHRKSMHLYRCIVYFTGIKISNYILSFGAFFT